MYSFSSATTATTPPPPTTNSARNLEYTSPTEMVEDSSSSASDGGVVVQSATAIAPSDNTILVDEFTQQMTDKVKAALADGKFSMREIASLTLAVVFGTQALFPSFRGAEKKQIAITVLHAVVRSLILLGLLNPEFNVALSIIPGVIDSVIYIGGGIEVLWTKYIPAFFTWLRDVVWGEDRSLIEPQHISAIVDTLDVTSVSGLKMEPHSKTEIK